MHMNANEHIGDDGTEMFQSWNKYDWMGVGLFIHLCVGYDDSQQPMTGVEITATLTWQSSTSTSQDRRGPMYY